MKLARLLGLGSSFFGGRPTASYRLRKGGYLPKFNDGRNPFSPKAAEAPPEAAKEPPATPPVATGPQSPARQASKSALSGGWPRASWMAGGLPAAKPARQGWTARLNPFRAPEPVRLQPPAVVQEELSLDAVKVVHNDLADAEVEVVPVKGHGNGPVAPPVLPPARQAWEYFGEKLMRPS